jgi:hypothetical protein
MAERQGLRLDRYRGISTSTARTVAGKLLLKLGPLLERLSFGADAWCSTFIFECVIP